MLERAISRGWDCRFSTELVSLQETTEGIVSQIRGKDGQCYKVTSKYLFGCDGARSQVVRELEIPLIKKPGGGLAINVFLEVNLEHLMHTRVGNLHWIIQPEKEYPPWAKMGIIRMVEPWTKYVFTDFYAC
jgi:2-polyprenyl-6-methoxyphenol hydroxylase-like FAD-dependent oxidoreductase